MHSTISCINQQSAYSTFGHRISDFVRNVDSARFIAIQTLRSSYRRTYLGPIWISLNQVTFVVGVGLLFSIILKQPAADHVAHVALGATTWALVSNLIRTATTSIPKALQNSHSGSRPLWFYALCDVVEQFLIFSHTFTAAVLIATFVNNVNFGPTSLVLILVLLVLAIDAFVACLWLGPLCARYRDLANAVGSTLILAGFLVPTFWSVDNLGTSTWIVSVNPLAWPIEVVRDIVTVGDLPNELFRNLVFVSVINGAVGWLVYRKVQSQLGLWS